MAIAVFVLAAAVGLDMSEIALAATIPVTGTLDELGADGHCSLREAIDAANADSTGPGGDCALGSGMDSISLPTGHFILSIPGTGENADASGDLDILSNLTIEGAGAGATTIDANHIDRALEVRPGRIVTITGVTITGGRAPGGTEGTNKTGSTGQNVTAGPGAPGEPGGGILNNGGSLQIVDSVVSGNAAGQGGAGGAAHGGEGYTSTYGGYGGYAVAGDGGDGGDGGGVFTTGVLTLTGVTVRENLAGAGGAGGLGAGGAGGSGTTSVGSYGGYGYGGKGGTGGAGGGLGEGGGGSLTVVDSPIVGNTAGAGGAGGNGYGGNGGGSGGNNAAAGGGSPGEGGDGGDGGEGGAISAADRADLERDLISANHAAPGGAGGGGTGGIGGPSTGVPGIGGGGADGIGGKGGQGGLGGGLQLASGSVIDLTVDGNGAGAGGLGGNAIAGNGGNAIDRGGFGGDASGGPGGNGGSGGGIFGSGSSEPLGVGATTVTSNTLGASGSGGTATAGAAGVGGTESGLPGTASPGGSGAPGLGGGAARFAGGSSLTLEDSIISTNGGPNCDGMVTDGGQNISFGDGSCPGAHLDPLFGPLADNGGPTLTRALLPGSPAIDLVPASGGGCPAGDQRGVIRPNGPACDAGAYEHAPPTVTTATATGVSSGAATLQAQLNSNARATSYHFELGTTTGYGASTPVGDQGAGVSAVGVSAAVGGLKPMTTYHYRFVATNADGTTTGGDRTFTTKPLSSARAPNTKIKKTKINQAKDTATFKFKATGEATGFQCRLGRRSQRAPGFRKCASPKTYRGLKPGRYTFKVRAIGPGGRDPSPAKKRFVIEP